VKLNPEPKGIDPVIKPEARYDFAPLPVQHPTAKIHHSRVVLHFCEQVVSPTHPNPVGKVYINRAITI